MSYHNVYFLVTNHLGGSIEEKSKGSSHKVIILKNSYFNLKVPENTLTKGSLVRPHTKAHAAGEVTDFNLKQLRGILLSVGITIDLYRAIKQERVAGLKNVINLYVHYGSHPKPNMINLD